jgi:hypothetical protein
MEVFMNKTTLTNIVNGKRISVMHGENFLVPIDSLPAGATSTAKLYIVGHSESGHNHVLESKANITIVDGERAILLKEVGQLFHQKSHDVHETVEIAPGAYQITHKTEYDPFQKVVRAVFD